MNIHSIYKYMNITNTAEDKKQKRKQDEYTARK
jgi:hypothetical protein